MARTIQQGLSPSLAKAGMRTEAQETAEDSGLGLKPGGGTGLKPGIGGGQFTQTEFRAGRHTQRHMGEVEDAFGYFHGNGLDSPPTGEEGERDDDD